MKPSFHPSTPRAPWVVRFPHGRRHFKTEQAAWDEIAVFLKGRIRLTQLEQQEYFAARDMLRGRNVSVPEAVRYYVTHVSEGGHASLAEVIAAFKKHKDRVWGDVHRTAIGYSLQSLQEIGGTIGELTAKKVNDWLERTAPGTRPQRFSHVRSFLRWAKTAGWIHEVPNVMQPASNSSMDQPHYLSVADSIMLLQLVREKYPEWLGAVVLKLFTGVRSFELSRMVWADIDIEHRVIRIRAKVAKKTRGRERPRKIQWWPDCLTPWLMLCRRSGPIVPATPHAGMPTGRHPATPRKNPDRAFSEWVSRYLLPSAGEQGIDLRKNDFRHTFATYAVGYFEQVEKVALFMGNSSSTLSRYYLNWESVAADAKQFFAIRPETQIPCGDEIELAGVR